MIQRYKIRNAPYQEEINLKIVLKAKKEDNYVVA
jgi:hypothetical protein